MVRFNLIKTRQGERQGHEVAYFYSDILSIDNFCLERQVKSWLKNWLDSYNNSLTYEEIEELADEYNGSFSYDVWRFELVRDLQINESYFHNLTIEEVENERENNPAFYAEVFDCLDIVESNLTTADIEIVNEFIENYYS